MIAPREIPEEFQQWNRRWSAPHGRVVHWPWFLRHTRIEGRRRGPFAWQPNNTTRAYEFPWANDAVAKHGAGLNVLEIGGGLSGLQFVLSRAGHKVTNVDPGQAELGFGLSRQAHSRLCDVFNTQVALVETTIANAGIADESVDVLLCVSALEHFPQEAIEEFATHAPRVLKPGGIAVLTVDLFLNVSPFTAQESNEFGRNLDIRSLLTRASLELKFGDPRELLGFEEFDAGRVRANLDRYLVGAYPAMAQCFVATRHVPRDRRR